MILHLTDNMNVPCKLAGEAFGMTKNAVIGIRGRIRQTYQDLDFCLKVENLDCGLSPLWWEGAE